MSFVLIPGSWTGQIADLHWW